MVAVVGVSASAQANLLAEIDALGTNLLTVTPGTDLPRRQRGAARDLGADDRAHAERRERRRRLPARATRTCTARRSCPREQTGGIGVDAAGDNLPQVRRHDASPRATSSTRSADRYPEVVLGAQAASVLQITQRRRPRAGLPRQHLVHRRRDPRSRCSLDSDARLHRLHLAAGRGAACSSAAAEPIGDLRARRRQRRRRRSRTCSPPTADPQNADGVEVSRPSDVLEARAAAKGQFTTLLLGLGAVALLVGAIGIANIMVISVLERRGEIGLRRALGATRRHISGPVPRRVGAARGARRGRRAAARRRRHRGLRRRPRTSPSSCRSTR